MNYELSIKTDQVRWLPVIVDPTGSAQSESVEIGQKTIF